MDSRIGHETFDKLPTSLQPPTVNKQMCISLESFGDLESGVWSLESGLCNQAYHYADCSSDGEH